MHVTRAARRPARFFYGWVVVGGAFAVMFLGFGCAYSFTAFIAPLQSQFSASRGEVSLIFAIAGFLYFALGAVSGPLADRFGPRRVVLAGMAITGAGLMLASRADSLWQIYAGYGLGVGVGVGFSYVPAIAAVQRWFVKRRGFASGVAVAGIGLGTLVVPPVAQALILHLGWRGAYFTLGAATLILGALVTIAIEAAPEGRGLGPDGGPPLSPALPDGSARSPDSGLGEAMRSRTFRLLYFSAFAASLGLFIPFVHLVPFAEGHGIARGLAIWLLSLIGLGSTFGRFVLGGLADRMGRRWALFATCLGMALMLAWWLVSTSFWALALFAVVFGTCYGGFVALMPALVMDYFGGRNVSGIIGMLYSSVAVGTLAGPSLAGAAFDLWGNYQLPITGGVAASLISALAVLFLKAPKTAAR